MGWDGGAAGAPVGDTHAASLTGADTHAADAASNVAAAGEIAGGATEPTGDDRGSGYGYVAGTAEQLVAEVAAFTPSTAQNIVFATCRCGHFTNAGTKVHTARARLDSVSGTLIASGSQTLGAGTSGWITITGTIADVTAAAHDIALTTQQDVSDVNSRALYHWAVNVVSGTLSGSDTHAATLTGVAGTCTAENVVV